MTAVSGGRKPPLQRRTKMKTKLEVRPHISIQDPAGFVDDENTIYVYEIEMNNAGKRLITAAPKLLMACKAALVTLTDDELYAKCKETIRTVEDAIREAEGGK